MSAPSFASPSKIREGLPALPVPAQAQASPGSIPVDVYAKARNALFKAAINMSSQPIGRHSLMCAVVAQRVLAAYGIQTRPVVGYNHLDGLPASIPHVWLVTPTGKGGDVITDLIADISDGARRGRSMMFLGIRHAVLESDVEQSYDSEARYPLPSGTLPMDKLREAASNLERYLEGSSDKMKEQVKDIISKATDNSLHFTAALPSFLAQTLKDGGAGGSPAHISHA